MFEKLKEIWKDKEDRRYLFRFLLLVIAAIAAGCFYYLGANAPQQNTAKSFASAFGRLDTIKVVSTFSSTSDKDAAQMFSEYYNTRSVSQFYAKIFTNYKFNIKTIAVDGNNATCNVEISVPNLKTVKSDLFPGGTGIASNGQWTDLYKSDASPQLFDTLTQAVADGKITLQTVTIQLKMVNDNGAWKIVLDKDLLDQLSGNAFTMLLP